MTKEIKATAPTRDELYREYKRVSEESENLKRQLSACIKVNRRTKQMIDVNWDLAPEGAEELVQFESHVTWRKGIKIWCMVQEDWRDYVSDFKAIATRPTQTKTVADAVEHFDGVWPAPIAGDPPPKDEQVIIYCTDSTPCGSKVGNYYAGGRHFDSSYFYQVCTRAEFEAYVKEQEGEKWTHEYGRADIKCRILATDGDECWILTENGNKVTEYAESLKPIKPTITKAEYIACEKMADAIGFSKSFRKYMADNFSGVKD